jgi:hypothetical protein
MKRKSVKKRQTFAYQDDPTFQAFRSDVTKICLSNDEVPLRDYLLYALWYVSKTFQQYWSMRPTTELTNRMIWILAHNYVAELHSRIVLLAWMRNHHIRLTDERFIEWDDNVFTPEWERIQPDVERCRAKRNEKRRSTRQMRTGRPKQTSADSLRVRILDALKDHASTTAVLALQLGANKKAIDSHLVRMVKAGELVKVERGLYARSGQ